MLNARKTLPHLVLGMVVGLGLPVLAQDAPPAANPQVPETDPAAAAAASGVATTTSDDPAVRMRGLEERVNDLKEKIFRSKARLMLLRETVLSGSIAGAKAQLVHENQMGSNFVLESASYSLDGAPLFNKIDTDGDLADRERIELFAGSIVPGNHNITVNLVYRGSGFGVFSYLKGYKFKIRSSYAFTAEEGKVTTVNVVAYEKGGITTDLQDRPAVRYDVEVKQETEEAPAGAAPAAAAPAPAAAAPAATP